MEQRCVLHRDRRTSPAWTYTTPCIYPQCLLPVPGMDKAGKEEECPVEL